MCNFRIMVNKTSNHRPAVSGQLYIVGARHASPVIAAGCKPPRRRHNVSNPVVLTFFYICGRFYQDSTQDVAEIMAKGLHLN